MMPTAADAREGSSVTDRPELDREYKRLAYTAWLLFASAIPMSAIALLVDLHVAISGAGAVYRWLFLGVSFVAALFCMLVNNILNSSRSLQRPGQPERSIPAQVASFATLLVTVPFSVFLLGFTDRLVLGGTAADFSMFLGITLVLWALFYPTRARYREWVRLREEPPR